MQHRARDIGDQHLRGVCNVVAQEPHPAICVPADGGVREGLVLGALVAFVLREQGCRPAAVQLARLGFAVALARRSE